MRAGGKLNVPVSRLTRGRIGEEVGNAPVLLLATTGRRSGQRRTAPVAFMKDAGNVV